MNIKLSEPARWLLSILILIIIFILLILSFVYTVVAIGVSVIIIGLGLYGAIYNIKKGIDVLIGWYNIKKK